MRGLKLQSLVLGILLPALLLVSLVVGRMIYTDLNRIILQGFDRKLGAIATVTGAFIDGDRHSHILKIGSETDPSYLEYILPMRRLKQQENLTFLYTQILIEGGRKLRYVLDANQDENHTPIGYRDDIPESDIGHMLQTNSLGTVFISPIHRWGNWGTLKTGVAPIFDGKAQIRGLTGADVDVSIIEKNTRFALFKVFLVAALSLVLGTAVSLWIARRLIQPIRRFKDGILRVAAGDYRHQVRVEQPKELAALSSAFEQASQALLETALKIDLTRQHENDRQKQELDKALALWGCQEIPNSNPDAPPSWIRVEGGWISWMAREKLSLRRRAELAALLDRGFRSGNLRFLFQHRLPDIQALAILDQKQSRVEILAHEPVILESVRSKETSQLPSGISSFQIDSGDLWIFSSAASDWGGASA